MSTDNHDDKKAEVFLALAKLSQESFFNRRTFEFKVAFGLWTAIGLITYVAVEHPDIIATWSLWVLGIVYLLIFVFWVVGWQLPLRRAFEIDKKFKHYYMHRAEGRLAKFPRLTDENLQEDEELVDVRFWAHGWWTIGQSAITVLFLVGSLVVMCSAAGKSTTTGATGATVDVKATGGAVKIQTEVTQNAKSSP